MDIFVDAKGESDLIEKDCLFDSDDNRDDDNVDLNSLKSLVADSLSIYERENAAKKSNKVAKGDIDLEEFERDMGWKKKKKRQPKKAVDVKILTKELMPVETILKKSAIVPGFEQLEAVPPYNESKRQQVLKRRKEREKTMGKNWFNLPATEVTDEIRHDLEVVQMRSVLDPKHFYKKNDLKALPKYFQIGKVMDTPLDYYSGRLTKKERKTTIVDELMADAEFSKFNKRKYKEIIDQKKKMHYKAHRHAKRLKGKKKK